MTDPKICEPGGGGTFFPLLESEQHWNRWLRAFLYLMALMYLFQGVNVVADKFVSSIERITSKKKRIRSKTTGQLMTVEVWNETIANLTLMALGSSAPEILLSIVEIIRNDFHAGELGPSTIVGSAAFNLFCIIAVCTMAIPSPETRLIKEIPVFFVTGAFSLFAYFWLVFIVQVSSPDVVQIWEGFATLALFGVLLVVSYMADKGYFSSEGKNIWTPRPSQPEAENAEECGLGVGSMSDAILGPGGKPIECAAGVVTFPQDSWNVMGNLETRQLTCPVLRMNGMEGDVQCTYRMESLTAIPGYDYVEEHGHIHFLHGESRATLDFTILPKRLGEHSDQFQIILEDAQGGAVFNPNSDGGEECNRLTVTICNETDHLTRNMLSMKANKVLDKALNMDSMRHGTSVWGECIRDAIFAVGGGDEDDDAQGSPSALDWVLHIVCMPWNLGFALLCPPAAVQGGWPCFLLSLGYIGGITTLIIDFAELFGCCAGIENSITAITLVALGTSMPDLFASKTSAVQDQYADASIVNVTGSNSVNVFLGIGLPWTLAAVYWSINGATEAWQAEYGEEFLGTWPHGAFIVKGGDLGFSVMVFTVAALLGLTAIRMRRVKLGGELGGPYGFKVLSAIFLVMLWVFYESLSIWKIKAGEVTFGTQMAAVAIAFVVLENVMLASVGAYYYFARSEDKRQQQRRYMDLESASSFDSLKSPPPLPPAPQASSQLRGLASTPDATVIGMAQHLAAGLGPGGEISFQDVIHDSFATIKFARVAMVCLAASRFKRRCSRGSQSGSSGIPPSSTPDSFTGMQQYHSPRFDTSFSSGMHSQYMSLQSQYPPAGRYIDGSSPRLPRVPSFYSVDDAPLVGDGGSRGRSKESRHSDRPRDSSLDRIRGAAGRHGLNLVGQIARTLADPQGQGDRVDRA